MHVGSIYGLAPKKEIKNSFQEWVYDKFQEVVSTFSGTIDQIALIGDNVDGYAAKDSTSTWVTDVNKQAEYAADLLSPLVTENVIIKGCSGSGYHSGRGTGFDGDLLVTKSLSGKHNKTAYYIETPHGLILFTHQSKNIKTSVQRFRIKNGESNGSKIILSVSGHLHRFKELQEGSVKVIQIPCWQFPTDFMGVDIEPVDIGCALIDINEYGVNTHAIRYSIPHEIEMDMYDCETIMINEIKERKQKEHELFAKLSGVKIETIDIIKNKLEPIVVPTNINTSSIKIEKQNIKEIKFPNNF
jgi:hypothetical protein